MAGKDVGILSERETIDKSHKSKIRQVRHAQKYMFGYLKPRNYTEALEFDKANKNSKWYDANQVFKKHEKAQFDKQKKVINAPYGYHGKSTINIPAIPRNPVKSTVKCTVKNSVLLQPPKFMQPEPIHYKHQLLHMEHGCPYDRQSSHLSISVTKMLYI